MGPIAAALSGGVDSAVVAARLRTEGRDIVGLTARLLPPDCAGGRSCCDEQDARRLCALLGVEHYVVDLSQQFQAAVIDHFTSAYWEGLTPNPCLVCNALIKFGALLQTARSLGCEALATGHYAIVEHREGRYALHRGADPSKDQSYMLLHLTQEQLACALFPVGESLKADVLAEAHRLSLPVAERESQDVCFISGSTAEFLQAHIDMTPGPIIDTAGHRLGTHRGLPLYTIGQRHGLDIGGTPRLYVLSKDTRSNSLVVGTRDMLERRSFIVPRPNWVSLAPPAPGETVPCEVMVRYRGRPIAGEVAIEADGACRVCLAPHDQAIAPGQGAAFYDSAGYLLGGGTITG